MDQLNKYFYILLAAVILFAAAVGYLLNSVLSKPEIIRTEVPVLVPGKDSLIIKNYYYVVHDTVKAEVKNEIAETTIFSEKVFDKDTLKAKTEIKYSIADSIFDVKQQFDLVQTKDFRIDTLKIKVPYPVEKDLSFFEKPYINYLLGIITSIILFFAGSSL